MNKVQQNIEFTLTKILAYLIFGFGIILSFHLEDAGPFEYAIIGSSALMGVKTVSDNVRRMGWYNHRNNKKYEKEPEETID